MLKAESYKFSLVEEQEEVPSATGTGIPPTTMSFPVIENGSYKLDPVEGQEEVSSTGDDNVTLPLISSPPPPPFAMNLPEGSYHPDFMFCGFCTSCQDPETDEEDLDDDKKLETYLNDSDSIASSKSEFFGSTKLQLKTSSLRPSQVLVLQALLTPIPGINGVVVDRESRTVTLEHDTSMKIESVLHALESAGHSAFIQDNKSDPSRGDQIWVRSKFYVSGICCASEVPAVKRIVKPLIGVSKLQINITTKMVNVEHDISLISAGEIAKTLTKEGFPTRIQQDGEATAQAKNQTLLNGKTTLLIKDQISEQDGPIIHHRLSQLQGVNKIELDLQERLIHIDHDVHGVSSTQFVDELKPRFECSVVTAAEKLVNDSAASTLDQIGRTQFVESTVLVKGLHSYNLKGIERAIFRTYNREQVRAIFPNIISDTIKFEHDPSLVSIPDIVDTLAKFNVDALVTLNGAAMNLYLPTKEDYPSNEKSDTEASLLTVHLNVWLSGIFWILSMFSYIDKFEDFRYFGLASVLFGMPPICAKAWRTMRRRQFDANCMMVTAALGALALQQFDEAGSVAFLFSISEVLEARATMKARMALKEICDLRPDHANVIHPITKEIVVVPADRVPLGSLVSVKTGDKIAADGIVVEGSSSVDESSLTGESVPIQKKKGDDVKGGTINIGTTQLVVRTTTSVEDSAVSRLIRLVEDAQSNRSPTEKLIDAFARSYTPSIMFMAVFMCTVPWISGVESGRYWMLNGLIIIVIACPCSLTISTPVTYAAGLAATAQRGIIVKGGAKLEAMGSVDRIVFDKTGTLTKGRFSVIHLEVVGTSKNRTEMLQLLTLIQGRSSHPISASLVQAAKYEGVEVPRDLSLSGHTILKGEGVTAQVNGINVFVGNQRLFDRLGMFDSLPLNYKDLAKTWATTGSTVGFVGTEDDGIIGIFCVRDAVREGARSVVQSFHDACIDVMMCTGDSKSVAHAVAHEVGIPSACVHSQLLPEDKLHFVGSLKRPQPRSYAFCREKRYILFCGDGVNDAPALAVADIGCSMGEGAAMAMEMSDVTLMDSNLAKLSYVIGMGRRVLRTVKENILISLVGKLVVVGLTFFGKMTLLLAIASDVGVMLIVTLNGMKLLSGDQVSRNTDDVASLVSRSLGEKERRLQNVEMSSFRDNAESTGYFSDQIV